MAYSGAQVTRLGLGGFPRGLYGSFAGKTEVPITGPHNPGKITRLGLSGTPRGLYGVFAGKDAASIAGRSKAYYPQIRVWLDDLEEEDAPAELVNEVRGLVEEAESDDFQGPESIIAGREIAALFDEIEYLGRNIAALKRVTERVREIRKKERKVKEWNRAAILLLN